MTLSSSLVTCWRLTPTIVPGGIFDTCILECRSGFLSLEVSSRTTTLPFTLLSESGGHRWQRIPPNEKRGRIHTSSITIAVLQPPKEYKWFSQSDVEIQTTRGTGPGGQHRNTSDTCVVAIHHPTGLTARIDTRSQAQNKEAAYRVLAAKVEDIGRRTEKQNLDQTRAEQIGRGFRGDKIKTYREKDNIVIDHRSGKRIALTEWRKGNF